MRMPSPAVVHIVGRGFGACRPAAFTWRTADGIAWLEPGYLVVDPYGSRPAFHRFAGAVSELDGGIFVSGPDGMAAVFGFDDRADDELVCPPEIRADIEWMRSELQALGTDHDSEMARMTEALAVDLGLRG